MNFFGPLCLDDRHVRRVQKFDLSRPFSCWRTLRKRGEKGIDVRIALDVIGKAVRDEYDVAIIFSQDQDLSEVADEIRTIARQHGGNVHATSEGPGKGSTMFLKLPLAIGNSVSGIES